MAIILFVMYTEQSTVIFPKLGNMRKITEEEKVDEKVEWIIECRRETDRQTLTQKEDESGTEVWT